MEINYVFEGKGDKIIVFIHGLSDSLDYWKGLSSKLSGEYQILRYDLRGHGKTPLGNDQLTMDLLANDLHDLLCKLNIKRASFVGLSLGGNVALKFAIKYPQFVENLIIMSTFSQIDSNLRQKFMEFSEAINVGYEEFFDVIIKYVLPGDLLEKNWDKLQENKRAACENVNVNGIKAGIEMGINFNVTDDLDKINVPTLILAGCDDDIITFELEKILNDNIIDSKLVFFENTKHDLLIGRNIPEILKLIRQLI